MKKREEIQKKIKEIEEALGRLEYLTPQDPRGMGALRGLYNKFEIEIPPGPEWGDHDAGSLHYYLQRHLETMHDNLKRELAKLPPDPLPPPRPQPRRHPHSAPPPARESGGVSFLGVVFSLLGVAGFIFGWWWIASNTTTEKPAPARSVVESPATRVEAPPPPAKVEKAPPAQKTPVPPTATQAKVEKAPPPPNTQAPKREPNSFVEM